MAILCNISLLKKIPKEINNIKIFHTLQVTRKIYVYKPSHCSMDDKVMVSSLKKKIDPWRNQAVQWFTASDTEIIFTLVEICTDSWERNFKEITITP